MKPTCALAILVAAGLAACGQDTPNTPPPPAPKVEAPKPLATPATGVATAPADLKDTTKK